MSRFLRYHIIFFVFSFSLQALSSPKRGFSSDKIETTQATETAKTDELTNSEVKTTESDESSNNEVETAQTEQTTEIKTAKAEKKSLTEEEGRSLLKQKGFFGVNGNPISDKYLYGLLREMYELKDISNLKAKDMEQFPQYVGSKAFRQLALIKDKSKKFLIITGRVSPQNKKQKLVAEQNIAKLLEDMKPERIGVNLYGYTEISSVGVFSIIADYIKKNNAELHIVGLCFGACANYLLPATKKITIEPYGVVALEGSITGLHADMSKAVLQNAESILSDFDDSYQSQDMTFSQFLYNRISPNVSRDILSYLLQRSYLDIESAENSLNLLSKLRIMMKSKQISDLSDLSEKELTDIIVELPDQETKLMKSYFIKEGSNGIDVLVNAEGYLNILDEMVEKETYLMDVSSPSDYQFSWSEFVKLITPLVGNHRFQRFKTQLRASYLVPETKKFFSVVPEASLLKKLGLNIVSGKNNFSTINSLNLKNNIKNLYLTEEILEKCEYFESLPLSSRFLNQCTVN